MIFGESPLQKQGAFPLVQLQQKRQMKEGFNVSCNGERAHQHSPAAGRGNCGSKS